jgi:hypothetical protein
MFRGRRIIWRESWRDGQAQMCDTPSVETSHDCAQKTKNQPTNQWLIVFLVVG